MSMWKKALVSGLVVAVSVVAEEAIKEMSRKR
jgi:hypothetical protein